MHGGFVLTALSRGFSVSVSALAFDTVWLKTFAEEAIKHRCQIIIKDTRAITPLSLTGIREAGGVYLTLLP